MGDGSNPLDAAPGLARIAVAAWVRSAAWTVQTSTRMGGKLVHAALQAVDPEPRQAPPREPAPPSGAEPFTTGKPDLRARGADLLRRSTEMGEQEDGHPAYELI